MSYSIRIKESGVKDLRRVARPDRARIVAAIDRLTETPHLGAALKGDLQGLRRLRLGTTGSCTKSGRKSSSFWSSASHTAGTPIGKHPDESGYSSAWLRRSGDNFFPRHARPGTIAVIKPCRLMCEWQK